MIDYEYINHGDNMIVSYIGDSGELKLSKLKIPSVQKYIWVRSDKVIDNMDAYTLGKNESIDQDGNLLMKKKTNRLNKYRTYDILQGLSETNRNKIHGMTPPIHMFCDIETEVIDGFPDVSKPVEKLLANAFCFTGDDTIYVQSWNDYGVGMVERIQERLIEHFKSIGYVPVFKLLEYGTEKEMLKDFLYHWVPKATAITGWNFVTFDWAFLMGRAAFLSIDVSPTSPTKTMDRRHIRDKYNPEKVTTVPIPKHRIIYDYLEIWAKWDRNVKIKTSAKLDVVSNQILGVKKVAYDSRSFMDLFRDDYETYLFYNAVDTILVKLIHEKINTFSTMQSISSLTGTPIANAVYATQVLEPLYQKNYREIDRQFCRRSESPQKESYSGGYVMEPKLGLMRNIIIEDFESLFPMITTMFNMGADTYLGEFSNDNMTITTSEPGDNNIPDRLSYFDRPYFVSSSTGQEVWYDKETMCFTPSGTVFDKTKMSVSSKIIWELFESRIFNKHRANDIMQEVGMLEKLL
jgi:DNA polymerase elongation subunit (family B)